MTNKQHITQSETRNNVVDVVAVLMEICQFIIAVLLMQSSEINFDQSLIVFFLAEASGSFLLNVML